MLDVVVLFSDDSLSLHSTSFAWVVYGAALRLSDATRDFVDEFLLICVRKEEGINLLDPPRVASVIVHPWYKALGRTAMLGRLDG
jgi:hypothetical protein